MSKVTRVMKLRLESTKVKSEILLSIAKKYRQELNRMLHDLSFLSKDKLDLFELEKKVKFCSDFSMNFGLEALKQLVGLLQGSSKTRRKIPKVKSLSFRVGKNLARLEKSTNENSKFDYFFKCSTTIKRKLVTIPVAPLTDFQKERMGQIKHGWVVKYYPESKSWFLLVPYFTEIKKEDSKRSQRSLGIDIGFSTLIATSDGDLIGENWSKLEAKISDSLTKKNKVRSKLRAKVKNTRSEAKAKKIKKHNLGKQKYETKRQRQKSQVKTEINTCVRKLFEADFNTLVLEDLSSMKGDAGHGRRTNRLLRSHKRGILKQSIMTNAQLNSVQLDSVHPAYTSQTCAICGFLSEENRRSQSEFVCMNPLCPTYRLKMNADVNGSRNILKRHDDPELGQAGLWRYPSVIKKILQDRFLRSLSQRSPLEVEKFNLVELSEMNSTDAMAHPGLELSVPSDQRESISKTIFSRLTAKSEMDLIKDSDFLSQIFN